MSKKSASPRVALIATPGVPLFELSTAAEVLGIDRRDITPNWYNFELCATEPRTTIGHGVVIEQGRGLAALEDADTVIIPACANIHSQPPTALIEAVKSAHERGARVVALCSGAFVLAEAGLLDGRRAATHWMHAPELTRRFPRVIVDADVLYVHDDVWTSAGSAAALDLCIELVRQDYGGHVANEVARRIVIPPHRNGGQAQFIHHQPPHGARPEGDVQEWVRRNLAQATVAGMVAHSRVSARTLNRQFRALTNLTPQEWLQRERLQATQELLESTDLPVDAIARRVGLGTATNLRTCFTRAFGVAPGTYRATFNAMSEEHTAHHGAPRTAAAG